ncbi:MAG: hypothetical protein HZB92_01520 [Euryarchaeota archaeon]|nr:hypothetical protein [Euryarchaeota archaeon]
MIITTISVRPETKDRLSDYKLGEQSYDQILNYLMDNVALEDVSREHLKRHYERLKSFDGVSKEEFKKRALRRLSANG